MNKGLSIIGIIAGIALVVLGVFARDLFDVSKTVAIVLSTVGGAIAAGSLALFFKKER